MLFRCRYKYRYKIKVFLQWWDFTVYNIDSFMFYVLRYLSLMNVVSKRPSWFLKTILIATKLLACLTKTMQEGHHKRKKSNQRLNLNSKYATYAYFDFILGLICISKRSILLFLLWSQPDVWFVPKRAAFCRMQW